jgi:hypothetical protein
VGLVDWEQEWMAELMKAENGTGHEHPQSEM